jgi:pyruvate ferredoxin oxidoreductase beta subunit
MANLKELSKKEELLTGGHRLCAGCGAPVIVRQVLHAIDGPVVIANATGCLEVSTTIFPYTAWKVPWIHNAFENVAATLSGVETAYRLFKKKGKMTEKVTFVGFGGDGGLYDIGLQSLSGAMERGHNMLIICYNNQAYMNTGTQRSSATPRGADTTTAPVGKATQGKKEYKKDLLGVLAAHKIPYAATATPAHWNDLITKVQKAVATGGPTFLNILSPCPRGWPHETDKTMDICRLAVDTNFWPLYEVVDGTKWNITHTPKEKKPVIEWFKSQGRFKHLFKPENQQLLVELQQYVDDEWALLKKKTECFPVNPPAVKVDAPVA